MTDTYDNQVALFRNLSHEQAVYIARVIDQYLKLDSETEFIEPEESPKIITIDEKPKYDRQR